MEHYTLSSSSVILSAAVDNDGGSFVNKRGFRLSTSNTDAPTEHWGIDYGCGDGSGGFTKTLEGLDENTTYYYAAYAANQKGYGFTAVSSFSTPKGNNSGGGVPVSLKKPALTSMEYSAAGFENSNGTKFSYKISFTVEIDVYDYENISRAGFKIGDQIWYWDNLTENTSYSTPMITMGNTSTLSITITAYAMMKDGSEYTGNSETINATYNNNNGGEGITTTSKYADYTQARTSYSGGHSTFVSYETMASHLNRYGLLIYKNGNSYYWKDFDGIKHTAMPDRDYKDQIYAYNYQMGNASNNYQVKKAYIYVSFRFFPF